MRKTLVVVSTFLIISLVACGKKGVEGEKESQPGPNAGEVSASGEALSGDYVLLPTPSLKGEMSLEEVLSTRRSVRNFTDQDLTLAQISQLLWACQGITLPSKGYRTAPSAGALYPLEVYLACSSGVYHYLPKENALELKLAGDLRQDLQASALGQSAVGSAPVVFVITGVAARTAAKYGDRAERYVYMEAGCAAENLMLEATALGLGGVTMGAFSDDMVAKVLKLESGEKPLFIIPIGYAK
jgi:SagB-type dehydrogenase family enzyme